MSIYFHYLAIIPLGKGHGPFTWTNLKPLHPKIICAKFGWNWHSGFGEEDENLKSLQQQQQRQRRRTTDKFWWEKRTWVLGSGELMRKNYTSTNNGSMCHIVYLQNIFYQKISLGLHGDVC